MGLGDYQQAEKTLSCMHSSRQEGTYINMFFLLLQENMGTFNEYPQHKEVVLLMSTTTYISVEK